MGIPGGEKQVRQERLRPAFERLVQRQTARGPSWLRALAPALLLLLFAVACDADAPDDDDSADTDDDDDAGDDDDSSGDIALVVLEGHATADAGDYSGTETYTVVAEQGQGDILCAIRYDWNPITPRDDCEACLWAWDLEASGAVMTAESGVGCAGAGVSPSQFEGEGRAHGFAVEYIGHADVLMVWLEESSEAVAFAGYVPKTGELYYEWETGYQTLE